MTPKGARLGDIRTESYWSACIAPGKVSSEVQQLEDLLEHSAAAVLELADKLTDFYATGGKLNYFISLYGIRNYGLVFSSRLMQKLAEARIELQLDIYPNESGL
ncbi:hypothetical protein [Iodobacter sp. BJB302]|uniref:hypothetical protein n=1 Tax=Iodobacter sp. BJB302 TaxID=1506510 RepID=UPI000C122D43|nr:hypothetical protein [Iodobacter sp. BJB302]